jgi:hypothetical protein
MAENILTYARTRYFWYALGLTGLSLIIFLSQSPTKPPSGNTWQGYTLGGVATALIIWLTLLGVRRRRYGGANRVEAWVSAHVYLGIAVFFIALLHAAFQVGWNVHTATFVLMIIVIVSGILGTSFYLLVPRQLAAMRQGASMQTLADEVSALNDACLDRAASCAPATALAVRSSIERTVIGGGVMDQLLARDRSTYLGVPPGSEGDAGAARQIPNADQQPMLQLVARLAPNAIRVDEAAALQDLVSLIARRQAVLRRMRGSIRLQGLLQAWLLVHVPVSIALLFALAAHILVVFLYW